jgi:hypothetical protein
MYYKTVINKQSLDMNQDLLLCAKRSSITKEKSIQTLDGICPPDTVLCSN